MTNTQSITLDLTNPHISPPPTVYAKQGDSGSRKVVAKIIDNGNDVTTSAPCRIYFSGVGGGSPCYITGTMTSGAVSFTIPQTATRKSGTVKGEVQILNSTNTAEVIATMSFDLVVKQTAYNVGAIVGTNGENLSDQYVDTVIGSVFDEFAKSTAESSGAELIGVSPIDGIEGDNAQAVLTALSTELNDIRTRANLFDKTTITLGFHKQDIGTVYGTARGASGDESNYFYSALIAVNGEETIWTNSVFNGVHPIYVLEFDSNKTVIASHTNTNNSFVTNANAKYICFSSRQTEIDENIISKKRLDFYRGYNDCDIVTSQFVEKPIGDLTDSKYIMDGYIFDSANANIFPYKIKSNYSVSNLISVGEHEKLVFTNNSNGTGYCALRSAIEGGSKTQITIEPRKKTVVDLSDYNFFAFEIATTSLPNLSVFFDDEYNNETSNEYLDKMQLKGLTIVFDGDSVAEGAGVTEVTTGIAPNNNKGWGYSIQNLCKDSICYGFAQSGWRIGRKSNESNSNSLLEHISQYPSDVDVFVLSGGYNDQAQQMALGSIVEHQYYSAEYDEYTTIGALESWICQLRKSYPLAKIMYVITGTRTFPSDDDALWSNVDTKGNSITDLYTTNNQRFELFFNSIEKVLNKWGIPYIDLRKEAGIEGTGEPNELINIQMWENGAGLHPTKICYDSHLAPKILNKIRSLI